MSDLAQFLSENLQAAGWSLQWQGELLVAERRGILSRWLLGSRRVDHRLRLKFDAAAHVLTAQELAKETIVGLPPPTLNVTRTKQVGLAVNEARSDRGWGGGNLRYGEVRDWLAGVCKERGWEFRSSIFSP